MLPSLRRAVTSFHLPGVRRTSRLASSTSLNYTFSHLSQYSFHRRHVSSSTTTAIMENNTDASSSKKRKATEPRDQSRTTKLNHTRKDDDPNDKSSDPHRGSYANPAQRKLFHVELPADTTPQEQGDTTAATIKRSKRKVAFLLGYLGTDYAGFQINEGQRTLQAEFELALLRCKLLDPRNFGYPTKYGWSTSGRTDKGVHAWYVPFRF
jgi:hypothetical protein